MKSKSNNIKLTIKKNKKTRRKGINKKSLEQNQNHFKSYDLKLYNKLKINPSQVIHLKGYASNLKFNKENNFEVKKLLDDICSLVSKNKIKAIVWDGDEYNLNSFTNLIPKINDIVLKKCNVKLKFIGFLKKEDINDRQKKWSKFKNKLDIIFILCTNELNWDELGSLALNTTKSKIVLCAGGGTVLNKEYLRILFNLKTKNTRPLKNIEFKVYKFKRDNELSVMLNKSKMLEIAWPFLEKYINKNGPFIS